MEDEFEVSYAGTVERMPGNNPRILYEHQKDAMIMLNRLNKKDSFSSMLVLPTGGGKTMTVVYWLLKEAVNNGKKILWVAHRHLLLEQAAETFQRNAYSDILYKISSFNYRIVSGKHDRAVNIKDSDDVLIISKDSAIRNLNYIDRWLEKQDEVYLVIDEAHHAIAKSYRKLIDNVAEKVHNLKILGLTATPFRTADNESGLLAKIFTDGIVFKIDLKDLIKKEILSRPQFEECNTDVELGGNLGINDIKSIEQLDKLPQEIAEQIASNKERNSVIVKRYLDNKDRYGQTLVFAINRTHAIALKAIFEKNGIPTAFIISGVSSEFTGINISDAENKKNIDDYRDGKIKVLINVNILTEGVDLPKTKTVFLARPTISTILMTQMVGRALRGEMAGGTKEAYVVSFIDDWQEHIAWVNPASLDMEESTFNDEKYTHKQRELRVFSIQKVEEFAKHMDDTVDTSQLDKIEFIKRVPLGMYVFTFIDENMERNYQVLVYDSTKNQYEQFIKDLPLLFKEHGVNDESIDENTLEIMVKEVKESYFDEYMLPKYDENDIRNMMKYYAQKECEPNFIPFDDIDRRKLDVAEIAKNIHDKDMRRSEMSSYIDDLWNGNDGIIRIYFNKRIYFRNEVENELRKIENPEEIYGPKIFSERRSIYKGTLKELEKADPEYAREIKDTIYARNKDRDGYYFCNKCGYKSKLKAQFQIDHIVPISKGGLTEKDNLQLLCRRCNMIKGNKDE